jgi:hypothetical protein
MKKINLFLIFMLFTVLSFGQLTVTLPTTTAMPGQTVTIPVKIYGAGTTGTPVSSANISIVYDTNFLTYDTTVNFYTAMPASQWYYSGNYNPTCAAYTASANWMEPSLGTLAIPDGTTLYEIQFIYKGGNGLLTYCINEFTNAAYDLIPTTPVNGGVAAPLLTGPADVCEGSAGNVYVTDANMTNYIWTVNGGVITAGGGTNTNTVTVTWPTAGNHSVTVTYNSTVTAGLPVTVHANSAVSISIAASQNNICAGTQVTFTATPTNGGANPVYQWKKNGSNVGSNQPTYAYVPANGDIITCVLTSGLTCTSGNPATSNSINMSVIPKVNVSVAIVASANPVTAGTAVTFTATPTNGGTSPSFQWKVNGVVAGTNTSTLTFTPVNGDQVFCLLTSSLTCVNNSVATSNVITMTVNTPPVNPLVVTLPNKLAIPGTTVIFPVKLKGAGITGTPISSANIQITYDPVVLDYDTLISFYSAMPSSQWFFSGNNNMVSANWMEPSLLTLAIPDSTTLFEIRFTYLGGTGQLPFVTYEFTNAAFDFIPTTPYNGSITPAFAQTGYVAGDFHQHTTYTDGSYSFAHVMAKSNQYNLDWWANSEHGGGFNRDGEVSGTDLGTTVYWDSYSQNPIVGTVASSSGHQNMWRWQSLRDYSFENVLSARLAYSNRMIFQGYEFNVPGHEHASMGLINNQFLASPNCNPLAEFEFKFDNSDVDMIGGVAQGWTKSTLSGHAKAVEAITWLQTNYPNTSYVIAAHPERKNLNNIAGFRDMNNAGPDVCFGFESMPGHQRGPDRGEYKASNGTVGTFTYGGCGIYAGKVGGLWDAMLSEGRGWWLFASSDFHNLTADFYPGEYQKTYTYVNNRYNPQSYIDGLRSGNSYIVNGDLIDSLQFRIGESAAMPVYASMGETFVNTDGSVVIRIKVRDPQTPNNNTFSSYTNPELNHIDLIMGKVHGLVAPGSPNYSVDTVATTGIIARFDAVGGVSSPNGVVSQAWTDLGNGWKEINYAYNGLTDTAYFRIRGTNLGLGVQNETDANGNPLSDGLMSPNSPEKAYNDLWFYSNPIFAIGPVSPALVGPQTVCEGATNQIYFTDSGQPSYTWTIQGGVIDIGGPASSFVSVTWTSAGQGSISVSYPGSAVTTLPVTVNAVPTPGITGNLQICSGGSTTLDAGAGYASYLWSTQATTQAILVSAPGTYSVVVTAANGCTGSASAVVTQSTPVVVSAVAGTIACPGGTTSVTVSATGGTAPYSGTGVFARPAGTCSFIVTDANGCTGSASVTIAEPSMFALKATKTSTNGAEISAFDPTTNRIYTVAGPVVEYYTLDNSGAMAGPVNVPFGFTPPAGTTALPNSVDVYGGTLAVSYAIVGANNAQQPGRVAFYNSADASFIAAVTVGYLPDMLVFSPDGTKVLTADEGEPNSYGQPTSFDPEGSVSIIDISGGAAAPTVTIAGFTAFNSQMASLKAAGVRIYGPGASVAQDLEPEYLAFSPDGGTVFVTLQENNAVAKLNLATSTITDIYPLGLKDYSMAGNGIDASDRDVNGTSGGGGKINIQNWPVKGMYQPDAIAQYNAGGNTYYITANEGDARDYTGFSEEVRAGASTYILDPAVFPNAATLKLNQNLGRLTVTNATGNNDGDTEFEEIQAFGARSFTIWNSSFSPVYDSKDQMEQVTAARFAAGFNSDGTSATFDSRSDNKGPEPEGLVVGMVNGSPYAFVGSERTGDVFIYDLSNPFAPVLKQYINTPADLGVEGIEFVPAGISPTGKALLITSAEVSKTVTVYEFGVAPVITLLGDQTVHICQNGTYPDAGATAVDRNGSNITGNIVTTNPVNTAAPGTYTVTYNVTDDCGIAANPVTRTVVVDPVVQPGITITASANQVCAGTEVVFTATAVNGGTSPVYQWKKNGNNVGSNSATYSYIPANNDVISCTFVSNMPCAPITPVSSNSITMVVNARVNVTVTIAASANPVPSGTVVTFTATPINAGPAPVYQWKVNGVNAGSNNPVFTYTPSNGDQVFCLLTSSLICVNNPIGTSNVITMTVTMPNSLLVTLPGKTAMPGDILTFPVKLTGAGINGVPISSANIQVSYDPAILDYDTLINFYGGTPASQWYFSGNNNLVSANWLEPSLGTIAIPDSTMLFEIRFTYLGGNSPLPFVVNEFTNATYDLIPTAHIDGSVTQLVPTNTTVANIEVPAGTDTCFNALQVITVAGGGTAFTLQNGGNATFIAGQRISFMPGTQVMSGGHLHGYITTTGQFCGSLPPALVSTPVQTGETTGMAENLISQTIRLYPNPTDGSFTIDQLNRDAAGITRVDIYQMNGIRILSRTFDNTYQCKFEVAGLPTGMYFVHIRTGESTSVEKLIKL